MQGKFSVAKSAWAGALLVAAGGLSKALWKLIVVTTDVDIWVMNNALFPLLGAGFTLLTVSFIFGKAGKEKWVWPVGILIIAMFYAWSYSKLEAPNPGLWMFVLLGLTSGFSTMFSLCLAGFSLVRQKFLPSILFVGGIAGSFYLTKLARIPEQTLALQWTAELINTAAQGAFLIGAVLLTKTLFTKVSN